MIRTVEGSNEEIKGMVLGPLMPEEMSGLVKVAVSNAMDAAAEGQPVGSSLVLVILGAGEKDAVCQLMSCPELAEVEQAVRDFTPQAVFTFEVSDDCYMATVLLPDGVLEQFVAPRVDGVPDLEAVPLIRGRGEGVQGAFTSLRWKPSLPTLDSYASRFPAPEDNAPDPEALPTDRLWHAMLHLTMTDHAEIRDGASAKVSVTAVYGGFEDAKGKGFCIREFPVLGHASFHAVRQWIEETGPQAVLCRSVGRALTAVANPDGTGAQDVQEGEPFGEEVPRAFWVGYTHDGLKWSMMADYDDDGVLGLAMLVRQPGYYDSGVDPVMPVLGTGFQWIPWFAELDA